MEGGWRDACIAKNTTVESENEPDEHTEITGTILFHMGYGIDTNKKERTGL
jgi:hypothetical protein